MTRMISISLSLWVACSHDDSRDEAFVDTGSAPTEAPVSSEPCDYTQPQEVDVGVVVTSDADGCPDKLHFYRFTPTVQGTYQIEKSGSRGLGYCVDETADGCICGIDRNCCVDCTLDFVLPDGSPLPAGAPLQIYVDSAAESGEYTFTVTGPL
ncbi:MAG: hypothetical protein AAF211_17370 [Myxococcota bacterium]